MTQQYGTQRPQPPMPGQSGLPPTGLQQQLASINQMHAQTMGMGGGIGFSPQQMFFNRSGGGGMALPSMTQGFSGGQTGGTTSLQQMANQLARQYGLEFGRGDLFDASGNPLMTPEQIANASGGKFTMGEAAAKMGFVSDAIARYQTEQAQKKAESTLQTGIGLVQSRARGSMAALQSGLYSQMAGLYASQEYEAADFSYYIQREQQLIENELRRKAEKRAKKGSIIGSVMGAIGLVAAPFTGGATLGIAAQGLTQMGNWI